MRLSFKSQHLKRYREILRLLYKYARSDVVHQLKSAQVWDDHRIPQVEEKGGPEELADDLERMGSTYVKLGQILSSRPDLLPDSHVQALSRLQDRVKPFPFEEVERIVREELGTRISKAFAEFDPEPLAAASLGQVHAATLRDGRSVVVKVQRPGIRREIADDMDVLEEIATFLHNHLNFARRYQFLKLLEEFKHTIRQELDYHREAANMVALARNLQEFPHIHVPLPIRDYTTRNLLTMERVQGKKITRMTPLDRLDLDGSALAEELLTAYLKQILLDGLFHADPHPGNVFLTHDNRIALLDLGMMGYTSQAVQEQLLKIILAVTAGHEEQAADFVIRMSETGENFDEAAFRRKVGQLLVEQKDENLREIKVGRALLEVGRTAADSGLLVPTELSLLAKTLLQLDEVGRCLDPEFNPNEAVRRNITSILDRRFRKQMNPSNLFASALDLKEFVGNLPGRLNKILDTIADSQVEVKVKSVDVGDLIDGFQKIANRITTGVILASIIVGASLLMQIDTDFQILGYPVFAILLFSFAAGMGLWLVISILWKDHRRKK